MSNTDSDVWRSHRSLTGLGQTDAEAAEQSLCLSADLCSRLVQKQTKVALLFKDRRDGDLELDNIQIIAQTFIQSFGLLSDVSIVERGKNTKTNILSFVFVKVTVSKTLQHKSEFIPLCPQS